MTVGSWETRRSADVYAVVAEVVATGPRRPRRDGDGPPWGPAIDADDVGDVVDPDPERPFDPLSAIITTISETTFFLFDPDSWR